MNWRRVGRFIDVQPAPFHCICLSTAHNWRVETIHQKEKKKEKKRKKNCHSY